MLVSEARGRDAQRPVALGFSAALVSRQVCRWPFGCGTRGTVGFDQGASG